MTTNGFYFDPELADLLIHVDELKKRKMAIQSSNENHLKGEQELLVGGWDNGHDLIEWGTRFHSGEDVKPERRLKETHSASKTIVPVLINDLSQKDGTLIQVPNFSRILNIAET